MSVPTEPGWYWWTDASSKDFVVEVYAWQSGLRVWAPHNRAIAEAPKLEDAGGIWGERIPDSPTLKARRELAEQQPSVTHGGLRDGTRECAYCGGLDDDHAPNCPWLLAQSPPPTAGYENAVAEKPSCGNCRFWKAEIRELPNGHSNCIASYCRRFPPIVVATGHTINDNPDLDERSAVHFWWPATDPEDCCGEHQPREPEPHQAP